jgi:hypothetical protein
MQTNMPLSRNVPLLLLMLLLLLSLLTTTSSSASSSSMMMDSVVAAQPNSWTPLRVSFDTLATATATTTLDETNQHLIRDALVTHGTISITDWPEIAQKASQTMAATQHDCLRALQTGEPWTEDSSNTRPVVRVRRLIDGTTRRTIATSSSSSSSSSSLMDTSSQHWPLVCQTWQSAAKIVQATTTETIQALARHVSLLETRAQVPLLTTRTTTSEMSDADSIVIYDTLEQVISHGDYLQHFHSYQQLSQPPPPPPPRLSNNASPNINMDQNHPWTIDWHVDQGMLLAFTPGRWTSTGSTYNTHGTTSTSTNPHLFTDAAGSPPNPRPELYIQDSSGQALAVQLDPAVDHVVFMLGDGWRQVFRTSTFHAVPHALQLPFGATATETATSTTTTAAVADARVWFGLMVLPPPNAIHPQSLLEHQNQQPVTFGEIRQRLIQGSSNSNSNSNNNENDNLLDLACSQNTHRAREIRSFPVASSSRPRFLAATDDASIDYASMCDNETQLYCWHTCQNLTVETSHHGCDETLRQLACVSNDTGLIWSGTTNGAQYQPQCVDHGTLVENVTAAADADADSTNDTTPTSGGVVGNSGSGSAKSSSWSKSVGLVVPVCMALWTAMGGWRG